MWASWTENIKKRVCRYLLQRYLGQYFEEKLTLDQLTVDIFNGTGTVKDVFLDTNALNALAEQHNLSMEFVTGHFGDISVSIPWSSIMQDSCEIEISGMEVTIQPRLRRENASSSSMLESMWTSMASSMQLAEECMKTGDFENIVEPDSNDSGNPLSGLEHCAQTIDAVLGRVKMCFHNTTIRIAHGHGSEDTGVACEFHIKMCKYSDALIEDENQEYFVSESTFYDKKITLEGVTCFTDIYTTPQQNVQSGYCSNMPKKSNLIQFGKFNGRHVMKIRIKKDDTIHGPHIHVDCSFGSLVCYLSPVQLHILLKLWDEFMHPAGDHMHVRRKMSEKPMDTFDFKRVEDELQEQLKPCGIGVSGLQNQQGWSYPIDEESEDEFHPFKSSTFGRLSRNNSGIMNSSTMSDKTADGSISESFISSVTLGSNAMPPHIYQSEKMKILLCCTNVRIILLEDDIVQVTSSPSFSSVVQQSVDNLMASAELFFEKVTAKGVSGLADGNSRKFDSTCSLNHLSLMAEPVKVEVLFSSDVTAPIAKGYMAVGDLRLTECLKCANDGGKMDHVALLSFPNLDKTTESVRFDFTQKTYPMRRSVKTRFKIQMQSCFAEIDLSIIDRIGAILYSRLNSYLSEAADTSDQEPKTEVEVGVLLRCPKVSFNFRFPIPIFQKTRDLNSLVETRKIRADYINIIMKNMITSTVLNSTSDTTTIEAKCQETQLYYIEAETITPVLIAEARSYDHDTENYSLKSQGFDWPRLLISFQHRKFNDPLDGKRTEEDEDSLDSYFSKSREELSPFSRKRIHHESQNPLENAENMESVIPGTAEEMRKFIEDTCANTKSNIQIDLRSLYLCFPSKYIFEQLYNRICMDLPLWEPLVNDSRDNLFTDGLKSHMFRDLKTGTNFDIEQLSDEEDATSFFAPGASMSDLRKKHKNVSKSGQSNISLNLSYSRATCHTYTQFIDASSDALTDRVGGIVVKSSDGNVFIVSGYLGDQMSGYVCAFARLMELHHVDLLPISSNLNECCLKNTIFPTAAGFKMNNLLPEESEVSMFTLALKIDREKQRNIKNFKIAMGIKGGTLNHVASVPTSNSWLNQLIDFFDVVEVPIAGYIPASVIMEFHLHLWECVIEYKPLHLALKSAISIDNLTISSNITAFANTFGLQILAEDAALYITDNINSSSLYEYICVMELDILELLLRMHKNSTNTPTVDLTASCNKLHIRSCSDSLKAMTDLFSYFAEQGDLQGAGKLNQTDMWDVKHEPEFDNSGQDKVDPHIHTEVEVADAMMDSNMNTRNQEIHEASQFTPAGHLDLYFEEHNHSCVPPAAFGEPIMENTNDGPVDIHPSDDDEEFCILENDPGVGIMPINGGPEARMLTSEPIQLVENHFALPNRRTDILKAPKHYPKPILRYTIHELTIVFDMFGGNDFEVLNKTENGNEPIGATSTRDKIYDACENRVDIGKDALEFGVAFSKTKAFESAWEAYEQPALKEIAPAWRINGGKGRNKDICIELLLYKIKFQHEVYPSSTEQTSRQVFVVNNLEVKDKLLSSEFNKMLYIHTSNSKPKQCHANMIVIKIVHNKTNPQLNIDECSVKVSALPLRLNIDQDALLFLYKFYLDSTTESDNELNASLSTAIDSFPKVSAVSDQGGCQTLENHENQTTKQQRLCNPDNDVSDSLTRTTPIYFRQIIVAPEIPVRLDYRGKRMDLSHGPLAGILMGLAQLNCSEIRLKRIRHSHGILGMDKLANFLISEWSQDIKTNQLPSLLGGVGPIHSFVQLFQGVRDLFWLPIEQYNKDGRIAKGIQRGANSFSTSTAMAAIEITNKMVHLIQSAAEFTYDMVSPGPSLRQHRRKGLGRKKRLEQPCDFRQGVTNAYNVVKDGLGDTAKTIVHVASKEHEQKGVSGAVGGVLRQLPPTVVQPIILVAEATSNVLDGVRSHLEPEFKKHSEEKWKGN